jgi:hypothetical protein
LAARQAAGEADEKETYKGECWQAGHDAQVGLRKQRELARRQPRQERESGGDAPGLKPSSARRRTNARSPHYGRPPRSSGGIKRQHRPYQPLPQPSRRIDPAFVDLVDTRWRTFDDLH